MAAVRDQVQSLVARGQRPGTRVRRVRVHRVARPRPGWKITACIPASSRRYRNLSFTERGIALGDERIVLSGPHALTIAGAGLKDDQLTLYIVEAGRLLRETTEAFERAEGVLRLARETLERLSEPARHIAAARALRDASHAIANAPVQALADAAAAPTDALKTHDPWMQHIFMVSRNSRLGDATPLEALRKGRLADVLNAARAFGEHGAA